MAKRVGELRKAETERGVVRATQRGVAALSDGQELADALRKNATPLVRSPMWPTPATPTRRWQRWR